MGEVIDGDVNRLREDDLLELLAQALCGSAVDEANENFQAWVKEDQALACEVGAHEHDLDILKQDGREGGHSAGHVDEDEGGDCGDNPDDVEVEQRLHELAFSEDTSNTDCASGVPDNGKPQASLEFLVSDVFKSWFEKFRQGCFTLRRRAELASDPVGGARNAGVSRYFLSLVSLEEQEGDAVLHSVHSVSLVAWVNLAPELLLGRRVKIRQGKILALVAANSKLESFVDTPSKRVHVLVPSIGEFAHHQPFKDAPQVPPLFSRLKLMWELSMGPASKSVAACVACEQHNDEDPVDCPLCLAAWHPTCCDTVLAGSSAQLMSRS